MCRWDYNHDERDNEIAELKKRLVEEQRKAKDAAAKAETDLKDVLASLQVRLRLLFGCAFVSGRWWRGSVVQCKTGGSQGRDRPEERTDLAAGRA
jgi:hypothetical protein